jgi:hypothetical protein
MARPAKLKHVREALRALERNYPGHDFECWPVRNGHVRYFVDGSKLADASSSPEIADFHVKAVLRDARRHLGLPKGAP